MTIEKKDMDRLNLKFKGAIFECQTLDEKGMYEECLATLKAFTATLPVTDNPEVKEMRKRLDFRRQLVEAKAKVPPLDPDNPHAHYRALFAASAPMPAAYFPFAEVLPLWQSYMLRDDAKQKFRPYKTVRVLAKANGDDGEALEALFYQSIQERFLAYGYKLVDLSTTSTRTRQETLVKITLSGRTLDDTADAQVTGESLYELTGDITSIRYTEPGGKRLPPRTWTLLERGPDLETTRNQSVTKLSPQVADAVFYLTLKQYFNL